MFKIILLGFLLINLISNIVYMIYYNKEAFEYDFKDCSLYIKIPAHCWYWLATLYHYQLLPFVIRILLGLIAVAGSPIIYFHLLTPKNFVIMSIVVSVLFTVGFGFAVNYIIELLSYCKKLLKKKKRKTGETNE